MALNYSFAGKRVLVTGGANGLGRSLVEKFHADNAIVFTIDYDEGALNQLKVECPKVTTAVVDMMDWEATRNVVTSLGRMDHLVNNAGVLIPNEFFNLKEKDIDRMNAVNYKAMINVTQVVAQGMVEAKSGGSIVNLASVGSRFAAVGNLGYTCTKAACEHLTKGMALELGPHNIRVNCINPSMMDTALLKKVTAIGETMLERLCIKRVIKPAEAADLVLFLLSPLASMITGENVYIDGGYSTN